jgi:hypothetical protein
MAAPSPRKLLRTAPLGLVLAGAVAAGTMVSPRPFSYNSWPKPPVQARAEPLVHVRSDRPAPAAFAAASPGPVRVAARLPAVSGGQHGRRTARAVAPHAANPRATRGSGPSARHHGTPSSPPRASQGSEPKPQGPEQQPAPSPAPPQAEQGNPPVRVAQAAPSTPLPDAAVAKPIEGAAARLLHAEPCHCGYGDDEGEPGRFDDQSPLWVNKAGRYPADGE